MKNATFQINQAEQVLSDQFKGPVIAKDWKSAFDTITIIKEEELRLFCNRS